MGHIYDIKIDGKEMAPRKTWHWRRALDSALQEMPDLRPGKSSFIEIDGESDMEDYVIEIRRVR